MPSETTPPGAEAPAPERPAEYTLLTVLGERPQVMTELIWSLAEERGQHPARVLVLTTTRGRRALRARLLGDPAYSDARHWVHGGRWAPFCREVLGRKSPLGIEVEVPAHADGTEIEDIYAPEDGRLFENWCFDLVHSLTRAVEGRPLYGCIAGGRKTMGQDVTTAFSLYARRHDRLFHVVASKKIEEDEPTFFWPREDRPLHARLAGSVHRVDKAFPHLRARLEDGLLSNVSGADEHSHYQDLLDQLDPDRRALAKPQDVTLRMQLETSASGGEVVGHSGSVLAVTGEHGGEMGTVRLPLKKLTTLLVLWERLWRPEARARVTRAALTSPAVDAERRAVYEVFHGETVQPLAGDFLPWNPEAPFYAEHGNPYRSAYSKAVSPLNAALKKEPALARYFTSDKIPAATLPDDLRAEKPVYAFPRPLPGDIQLRIEVVPDEQRQLLRLAEAEHWPFEQLPLPEVAAE